MKRILVTLAAALLAVSLSAQILPGEQALICGIIMFAM